MDTTQQAKDEAATQSRRLLGERRKQQDAFAVVKRAPGFRWQLDPRMELDCVVGELLEALYPLSCRVARRMDNDRGQQLLLWLILGGVARTARCALRSSKAPHLVQPSLIAALKEEFGANFIRNEYARRVSRLFDDAEEGYWDTARRRLLDLLRLQLLKEQVHYWAWFIGEDSRDGIAVVARHCQLVVKKLGRGRRSDALGHATDSAGSEAAFSLPGLGWDLFLETGEHTFRKLCEGELPGAAKVEDELANEKGPEQAARRLLQGPSPTATPAESEPAPPRERVAGVAAYFCRKTGTKAGWKKRLQTFAGGDR